MGEDRNPRTAGIRSCVHPAGRFVWGIHRPAYRVENLRENDFVCALGWCRDGAACENRVNFPSGCVTIPAADTVYEVANPFPFRGATYILKRWADRNASRPETISLPRPPQVSFTETLKKWQVGKLGTDSELYKRFADLPAPLRCAIAETSTDPADLVCLAELACSFVHDEKTGQPKGLRYETGPDGRRRPVITDSLLFEMTANNIHLPDPYKEVMVLRPGVQGDSEIMGEYSAPESGTHVFEYLRRNSYIPGGHYAANNAHDAVRYRASDLSAKDMQAMRHFYYQRTFIRLAGELGLPIPCERRRLSPKELESLRGRVLEALSSPRNRDQLKFNRTLWGWNFGFDYAPSGYRLHASHQQIHQQYAMVPAAFEAAPDADHPPRPYACGDLVAEFIEAYHALTGARFFDAYIQAIRSNRRMDETGGEASLVIYSDENVMVFVPKAQTSQWEVQLMTLPPVGNILEAAHSVRDSIDRAMLVAVRILEAMGARMITAIEYAKALDQGADTGQRLMYAFLPRLPESPGAFSEAQLRWINGHYPEDFAAACRSALSRIRSAIQ